jgi:hypothetical protein
MITAGILPIVLSGPPSMWLFRLLGPEQASILGPDLASGQQSVAALSQWDDLAYHFTAEGQCVRAARPAPLGGVYAFWQRSSPIESEPLLG